MIINIRAIENKIRIWSKNAINNALPTLKQSIEDNTPEDTRNLVSTYETNQATQANPKGIVFTRVDYAKKVEYGVGGRVYRYQKPKGNKGWRVWVGARMFAIGYENARQELIKKMQDWFRL